MPKMTPERYTMDNIKRFCFVFLFVLNRRRIPTPEPARRPERTTPRGARPERYTSVRITDEAQFGMRPISAEAKYEKIDFSPRKLARVSEPITKIKIFIMRFAIKIKSEVFSVWMRAERKIFSPQ